MDILEDLYYGNLFPYEKCANLDDEMKELIGLLNRNEEKLTANFSNEQKEIGKFLKSASGNPLSQALSLVQRLSLNQ